MVYTLISVPLPDSGENGRLVGLIWADPISDSSRGGASFSEVEQALRAGRGGGIGKELSKAEDDDEETEEKEGPLCSLRALGQAEKRQDKTRKEKTRQDKTRKEEKRKEKKRQSYRCIIVIIKTANFSHVKIYKGSLPVHAEYYI